MILFLFSFILCCALLYSLYTTVIHLSSFDYTHTFTQTYIFLNITTFITIIRLQENVNHFRFFYQQHHYNSQALHLHKYLLYRILFNIHLKYYTQIPLRFCITFTFASFYKDLHNVHQIILFYYHAKVKWFYLKISKLLRSVLVPVQLANY